MSSGLDQLTAQRAKSTRRSMPPPRNPPRSTPVEMPVEPEPEQALQSVSDDEKPPTEAAEDSVKPTPTGEDADRGSGPGGDEIATSDTAADPDAAAPEPALTAVETAPVIADPSPHAVPKVKPAPRPKTPAMNAVPPPVETSGAEDELAKYSIYFDGTADEFLEATRVAGRRLKPKLSISRSSVVRLALERLSDSMSPDEVALELSRNAAIARSSTGRPRL